jgi:hypothetical protein
MKRMINLLYPLTDALIDIRAQQVCQKKKIEEGQGQGHLDVIEKMFHEIANIDEEMTLETGITEEIVEMIAEMIAEMIEEMIEDTETILETAIREAIGVNLHDESEKRKKKTSTLISKRKTFLKPGMMMLFGMDFNG